MSLKGPLRQWHSNSQSKNSLDKRCLAVSDLFMYLFSLDCRQHREQHSGWQTSSIMDFHAKGKQCNRRLLNWLSEISNRKLALLPVRWVSIIMKWDYRSIKLSAVKRVNKIPHWLYWDKNGGLDCFASYLHCRATLVLSVFICSVENVYQHLKNNISSNYYYHYQYHYHNYYYYYYCYYY